MTKRQFIFMALLCSFETYFFNQSVMDGSWIFAIFLGSFITSRSSKGVCDFKIHKRAYQIYQEERLISPLRSVFN